MGQSFAAKFCSRTIFGWDKKCCDLCSTMGVCLFVVPAFLYFARLSNLDVATSMLLFLVKLILIDFQLSKRSPRHHRLLQSPPVVVLIKLQRRPAVLNAMRKRLWTVKEFSAGRLLLLEQQFARSVRTVAMATAYWLRIEGVT